MSIDSSESSSATLKEDILKIDPENLDFVPDCIWASPPCETYSNLSGGAHRSCATGEFEKSEEARLQNYFFQRMSEIMHWAKKKHPHLIVVIENPVGSLKYMPLMKEFITRLSTIAPLAETTRSPPIFGRMILGSSPVSLSLLVTTSVPIRLESIPLVYGAMGPSIPQLPFLNH